MVRKIWCETNEEVRVALTQLERQGCRWADGRKPTAIHMNTNRMTVYIRGTVLTMAFGRSLDAESASKLYTNLLR